MELVDVARVLARRRFLLLVGAVLALGIAVAVRHGSQPGGAIATTRVLLDTPRSALVEVKPRGADTLAWRAELMTNLLASSSTLRRLAASVGVARHDVAFVDPSLATPPVQTSLATAAGDAASITTARYVLTAEAPSGLPMITLQAATPDRASAQRLVDAAVAVLQRNGTGAGGGRVQGFHVALVRPVRSKLEPAGHGRLVAIASSIVFFVLWCSALAIVPALLRAWRTTVRLGTA